MSAVKKPVVTTSRKRFQRKQQSKIVPIVESPEKEKEKQEDDPSTIDKHTDKIERTTRAVGPVYDAGGGAGFGGLTFKNLKDEQDNMYRRTLSTTDAEDANVERIETIGYSG